MGRKKKKPLPESMDGELEPSPKDLRINDILTDFDVIDSDDDIFTEDMFPELY